jgi:hypothetical protein
MSEYLGIKVVKKEGTKNTFEVTIPELSPFNTIPDYTGESVEDMLLQTLANHQAALRDHIKSYLN